MQNPIAAAVAASGLTRAQFAVLVGLSYHRLSDAVAGRLASIPKAWRARWVAAGLPFDDLAEAYDRQRADDRAAVRQLFQGLKP